jgi:hypothetical protein
MSIREFTFAELVKEYRRVEDERDALQAKLDDDAKCIQLLCVGHVSDMEEWKKQLNALQTKLAFAVQKFEEISTYPAVVNLDFTMTIATIKHIARDALAKLEGK